MNGPRLRHPGRDYILFEGPLDAVTTLGRQVTDDWFIPQSPNLFWPEDQSWCVATEIDYDSSIVAGTSELVAAVMAEPTLETWRVDPDDSLMYDGDTVNT